MKHKSFTISFIFLITVSLILFIFNFSKSLNTISDKKVKKSSGALESLQWMSEIRAYPDKDIPPDKFFRAYEYSRDNLADVFDQDNPDAWTSIGPNNIGGRSIALAVHPADTNVVFIGSASGGLWKSTSGGLGANAWTQINTGFHSLAVSSIAIDSVNHNIMYIGTGENYGYQYSINNGVNVRVTRGMYGIGILKTTNGGQTWTKSLDWSYNNQRGVWKVMVNPRNPNIIYAATSEGVFKSYNAGGSWSNILNYQMVMDMLINPVDTGIIYASVGNLSNNVPNSNVGLYKSVNGGTSWTKLSDGSTGLPTYWTGKTSLTIFYPNPNIIFASISNDINSYLGLYRTTNGGTNWTITYSNSSWQGNQGWYNNSIMIKPNDQNSLLGGALDVYKSTNFGVSFTKKSVWSAWNTGATPPGDPEGPSNFVHADVHYFTTNPKDPNKVYIAADGGLYRTDNFGETYYSCNGGYVTSQFYGNLGNSFTDSVFCVGGLQDNRAAFYQGTVAWYKTFGGDGFNCQVNSQNPSVCYTEYTYGAVSRSNNGGVSWSSLSVPNSGSSSNYCFNTPYIVCPSNPNIMYIAGTDFYKSSNGGTSFSSSLKYFNGGKALSMSTSWLSTDTIYVGTTPEGSTNAAVWRSLDGGVSWTNVSGTAVPNRYPTDLFANPYKAKEIYATFGGFGAAHVLKSTDAGNTWINITGNLPDVPHQSVMVDPLYPNNVYAGNDLGVYASTNGGQTWGEYRTGMPYAIVFDIAYVPVSRKIRALTHGSGIWERKLSANPSAIGGSGNEMPEKFTLGQNYPNPFNSMTRIKFDVSRKSKITIRVYDITGRAVNEIISKNMEAGTYEVTFDASGLGSGIYFYTLITDGIVLQTKKMTLLK